MKKSIVGLKELRTNIENYISKIERGRSFVVVRKSKPIFKIVPPETEEQWETVIDFTTLNEDGLPAKEILKSLRKLNAES